MSESGGGMTGTNNRARLDYSVKFRDENGVEQVKRLASRSEVIFEGTSAKRDCSSGANAKIEVDSSEDELLANPAGRYGDRLLIAADPI